ncbi:hypothetical protein [Flavobacterium sp. MDT1-60]|uniref:hypothetical protein n=1 Tax=Flavobacterium sp. MDT1-60 TaxID=1979344 RepID=UPI001782C9F1|nr:hypothetical protein [Flavobacterium sp. MDT1-60]QOG02302.1 hypothetical protein IHE43_21375 [Flavobacterium sp. MDT1-60]
MRYQTYIQELLSLSPILHIEYVQLWLIKHENEFHNAINDSHCRKWDKWMSNNEKPFPCVCNIRQQDCMFIEAYYKLNNAYDLYKKQQYLIIGLVPQYQSIKNNKAKLKTFNANLNALGLNLPFDSEIVISLSPEPYKKIVLQLNEKEFTDVIEFQELLSNIII